MSTRENRRRIVVTGMSCRFSVADHCDKLWSALVSGENHISPLEKRFPGYARYCHENNAAKGKSYVTHAALLKSDIQLFDSDFFELSAKEAENMDVQQRLLLEVTNEAVEDAGITINGTDTGVFIGGFTQDALINSSQRYNYYNLNKYSATGSTLGMLANRLSYFYDIHGPSITIDTACSSSLIALHYAYESIQSGVCDTAICGGVNVIQDIQYFISLSKGEFLAKDSICKAFGNGADGYARGEGAGVLVLRSFEAATLAQDRVYCEIIATDTCHDGHKNGITLPNPKAQEEMLSRIYGKAGIGADDVGYIEAHGTGTQAGDKAETLALNNFFKSRSDKLAVGSIKTNIGHTEAAAGIAGVIKAILVLKNKKIPKSLYSATLNRDIPFNEYILDIPQETQPLRPASDGRCYIGVNGFGFGGSNAHVILASPERVNYNIESIPCVDDGLFLLMISARSEHSLRGLAESYVRLFTCAEKDVAGLCAAAALRRTHYEHRLAIVAEDKQMMARRLEDFAQQRLTTNTWYSVCNPSKNNKTAFLFSGMGPQHDEMGMELFNNSDTFKNCFLECADVFASISGIDLVPYISGKDKPPEFFGADYLQPFNLAYQIALFKLLTSLGVPCDGIAGHSAGEMAAFHCGGLISLQNIFMICYHRSRLQQIYGKGKMLAMDVKREHAERYCARYPGQIYLAAVNGENSHVLSGDEAILKIIQSDFDGNAIFMKGDIAYHSGKMDLIKDEFLDSVRNTPFSDPTIPLYSTVSGTKINKTSYTPEYWWQNIRNPVEFHKCIAKMEQEGYNSFIEIGAHPVLGFYVSSHFESRRKEVFCAFAQNRNTRQESTVLRVISELYVKGVLKEDGIKSYYKNNMVWKSLPNYTWDKRKIEPQYRHDCYHDVCDPGFPILGRRLNLPLDAYESVLNTSLHKGLEGHAVMDGIIFPTAGYVEMLLEKGLCSISSLEILSPAPIHPNMDTIMICVTDNCGKTVISSTDENRSEWIPVCQAGEMDCIENMDMPLDLENACELGKEEVYAILKTKSLSYKDGFRIIESASVARDSVSARICQQADAPLHMKRIYAFDAMLQATALASKRDIERDASYAYLPKTIGTISINPDTNWDCRLVHANIDAQDENEIVASSRLFDSEGRICAVMNGICFARIRTDGAGMQMPEDWVCRTGWDKLSPEESGSNALDEWTILTLSGNPETDCEKLMETAKKSKGRRIKLLCVTKDAVKILPDDRAAGFMHGMLWGMCRVIALEYSNISIRLADADDIEECLRYLRGVLLPDGENEIGFRDGALYGLRLTSSLKSLEELRPSPGTTLITGASGGIGYELALTLAAAGVKDFAFLSRHLSAKLRSLLKIFSYYGINGRYYQTDLLDREQVVENCERIYAEMPEVTAVYHLAGVAEDKMLTAVECKDVMKAVSVKVNGATNVLDGLTGNTPELFVMFGSLVGLTGNAGQAAYACANACIESYRDYLDAKIPDVKFRMMGFGAVDTGMAVAAQNIAEGFRKQGISLMPPDKAIGICLRLAVPSAYIAQVDWKKFAVQANQEHLQKYSRILSGQGELRNRELKRIMKLDATNRLDAVIEIVRSAFADALECAREDIALDRATNKLGVNSLNSVLAAGSINRTLGTNLAYYQIIGNFSLTELCEKILREECAND